MIYGIDYIGIKGCMDALLRAHPRGWALGALAQVDGWGKAYKAIDRALEAKMIPVARIHLMWKDNHRFTQGDIAETVRRAQKLSEVIIKHPNVKWYVSPWLEATGASKQLLTQVITSCKMSLPSNVTMVVNSTDNVRVSGALSEGHHSTYRKGDPIFSFDGLECVDANMKKWQEKASKAKLFFFWRYTFNGKYGPSDKRARGDRTSWPSHRDIRSLKPYIEKKGKTSLPSGWLYKTHGERKAHFDADANKPALLTKKKFNKVQFRAKGRIMYTLEYTGTAHGSHVYRVRKWGYQLANQIKRQTGKKITTAGVICDGVSRGRVNVAWRDGIYRDNA